MLSKGSIEMCYVIPAQEPAFIKYGCTYHVDPEWSMVVFVLPLEGLHLNVFLRIYWRELNLSDLFTFWLIYLWVAIKLQVKVRKKMKKYQKTRFHARKD